MFSKKSKGASVQNQGKGAISSLLWMLFGAVVTLGVGVFMYKSGVFDLETHDQVQKPKKEIQTKVDLDKAQKDQGYEFYEILPDQNSKNIPDTIVPDQPTTDSNIQVQVEQLKPDVVVTGTQEELEASDPSHKNTQKPDFKPVVGDAEVTVKYEDGTYGDESVNTGTTISKPSETTTVTNNQAVNNTSAVVASETSKNTNSKPLAVVQPASEKDKEKKPTKSYILQINSVDSADEADSRRAQVMMAGVDAYVVKKVINDQTVYQVVSNSMSSKESVIKNQQRLKNSGISSLVIEQRVK